MNCRKRTCYLRDFEEDDLVSPNNPNKRRIYWYKSQEDYKQKLKIKKLQCQNKKLVKKINNMESLIGHLKNENKISENCFTILKVRYTCI